MQGNNISNDVLEEVTRPVPVDLLFVVLDLQFVQKPFDDVSLGNDPFKQTGTSVYNREPSEAEAVELDRKSVV